MCSVVCQFFLRERTRHECRTIGHTSVGTIGHLRVVLLSCRDVPIYHLLVNTSGKCIYILKEVMSINHIIVIPGESMIHMLYVYRPSKHSTSTGVICLNVLG